MQNKNLSQSHWQKGDEMDNDDLPVGRILSRREVLALLGTTGAVVFLSGCLPDGGPPGGESSTDLSALATVNAALPAGCVVRPELTEGPVFVEEDLNRSDIRTDPSNGTVSEGTPFDLTFRVSQVTVGACMPLAGVQVDVWHCNAEGIYSRGEQSLRNESDGIYSQSGGQTLLAVSPAEAGYAATFEVALDLT